MSGRRTVLHVDLDAFYASVEQRDDPALRGRPVIVGGTAGRGVVCAASYEARRFGVRSAMPMARAVRLCPRAVVLPPRMAHYAEVSRAFFGVLDRYSPLVEGLSLDEAFLDVTGEERLLGDGPTIARAVKRSVAEELRLVASVGVAPSKFVAKIASDLGKPDGLLVVAPEEVTAFLDPLPLGRLWGVGRVTEQALASLGLSTVGEVARAPAALVARRLGAEGAARLQELARGIDERAVVPDREPVSVGQEETFAVDLRDRAALGVHLLAQADAACARLRRGGHHARVVVVKVKYADFALVTRRATLPRPTTDARLVGETARRLLARVPDVEQRGVLTGVSLAGLEPDTTPRQLSFLTETKDGRDLNLFEIEKSTAEKVGLDQKIDEVSGRSEQLGPVLDAIAARFGSGAVRRAVHLDPPGRAVDPARRDPRRDAAATLRPPRDPSRPRRPT